jgi:nucleoid-associated protein YgaU
MIDEYGIFFDMDGVTIRLPINPDQFSIKTKSSNKTYELVNIGEINILRDIPLRDISFKSLLPDSPDYPYVVTKNEFQYPKFYLDKFREYKQNKKPVRLIIIRKTNNASTDFSTNMLVSIEDFEENEEAGSFGWWNFSISLKEYKEYSSKKISLKSSPVQNTQTAIQKNVERPTTKTPPKTYKIKDGDTLWAIAKKELNNGSKYTEIAKLNNIPNPSVISVGKIIKLPALA